MEYKYTIHIEYSSDQPQEIFTLGFDIIKGSDIVTVDGVRAERDADYFIDYEAGIITFLNKALIKPDSKIRVDYEYLPFGGQFERTILGGRLDVNVNPQLSFGTTLLYDFAAEADEVPSIFEDKPNENAIFEIDAQLQAAALLFDWLDRDGTSERIGRWKEKFALNLGGEWAWAAHSPNTFGAAIIEDFEAIENLVSAGFGRTSWQPGSLPPADTAGLLAASAQTERGAFGVALRDNFGHKSEAALGDEEKQTSLQVNLDFAAGETWIALRQPLSTAAINFENMTSMELYTSGLPGTLRVYVDVGVFSEDADGDGILDSEDKGLDGIPGSGDAGENNGVLNTGEDNGISFNHANRGLLAFGTADGSLTTEDMNGNFRLDQQDAFYRLGDLNTSPNVERKTFTGFSSSTWMLYRAPWRTRNPVGAANTGVVKQIRLVFVRQPGQDTSVTFFMDQLTFRGNRFTGSSSDSRIVLLPRNNENDPNYASPSRPELRSDPDKHKEQSLGLRWTLVAGESSTVKQNFTKAVNLSDYQRLSFLFAGDGRGETFSLMLVSDERNYIEIRKRVTTGGDIGGIYGGAAAPLWERIDVPLDPIRQATIANILGTAETQVMISPAAGYTVHIVGEPWALRSPSLSQINQIWLRVQSTNADTGEVWIDDIYAAEPMEQSGTAQKAQFDARWGDLWTLSGSWRDVPGKYRGVGIINDAQTGEHVERDVTSVQLAGTLNIHRFFPSSWQILLPLSASWSKNQTVVDPDRVENTLASDLGKISSENQNVGGSLQVWKLPAITVNYGRTTATRDYRLDDYTTRNENLNANTAYSFAFPRKLFGVIPTGQSLYMSASYGFTSARNKTSNSVASGLNSVSSRRENQNLTAGINARPFEPLSLSYDYNMGYLDQRSLVVSELWRGITNRLHRVNSSLTLPSRFGISPGLTFSGGYAENFNRATFGGRNKDLNLSGVFGINVGVNPAAWSRLLSFLSVRYNYSLSSVASYRAVNTGTGITDVFGDYVGQRLFPWGSSASVGRGTDGVTASRSSGSTNIVHNLSGDIRTFNWLQTSYSASFTRNEVASLSTISLTDGITGTLNMRMDYMQAFPNSFIKFRSSYLTAAVSYGRTENAASRSNTLSPTLNWNAQWTDALNTTFSLGYNRATTASILSPGNRTVTHGLNPSLNFTYYFDLRMPSAVSLPGVGQVAELNRRVQLSGGVNANLRKTELGSKVTSEQNNYGLNLSLGYRIASNLELTASTTGNWLQDRLETQNDFFTVGGGARVEWRF